MVQLKVANIAAFFVFLYNIKTEVDNKKSYQWLR